MGGADRGSGNIFALSKIKSKLEDGERNISNIS